VLLSGFYEAYLDYIIICFLQEKLQNCRLTLDMKVLLLFVVLCGYLDLDPEAMTLDEEMLDLPSKPIESFSATWPDCNENPKNEARNLSSPWTHVENLVHELRTYRDGMCHCR
tara:strand:- start:155 stop:493 length:339 start_codon:yes stop_codon:yes gene_type:complete